MRRRCTPLDVTPGNLCEILGSDAATVTTLTLTGSADARDLHFAAQLPALRSLDMSGLQIVDVQSDTAIMLSRYQYPANVLPAYIFALSKLETVTLPSTLTAIEECAFASAKNLRMVTLPASLRSIGDWAFYGTALTSVTLPAADTLGTGIFAECGKLAEARLSAAKVTTLLTKTFRGCTALRTVTFPAAMSALGDESLLGSGLEVLDLPSGIKEIGAYAASSMPLLGSYTATNPKLMDGAISFNPYLNKITGQEDLGRLSLAHSPALVLDSATTAGFATIGEYALADNPGQRPRSTISSLRGNRLDGMGQCSTSSPSVRWKWREPCRLPPPEPSTASATSPTSACGCSRITSRPGRPIPNGAASCSSAPTPPRPASPPTRAWKSTPSGRMTN